MPTIDMSLLLPGDILLYASPDLIDKIIEWKEGGDVAHCEGYVGNGKSWASRNGIGVNEYPFRPDGLVQVRRPDGIFDMEAASAWFNTNAKGRPYGFGDIAATVNLPDVLPGMDCSHFLSALLHAAGCPQFDSGYNKQKITPRDFQIVRESTIIFP